MCLLINAVSVGRECDYLNLYGPDSYFCNNCLLCDISLFLVVSEYDPEDT